jgi:site-specific DNA recombinase
MATRIRTKPRTIADGPLRAVAYVRLSKAKATAGDTEVGLETQLAGCQRAITAMGGTVIGVEQDIQSGDRLDRPGFWRAVDRVRADEANAVVVYALDRLGRDGIQQGVVLHTLRGAGGQLFSATEDLQNGAMGDFLRSAATFAAAVELEKVRERTNRGLDAKFRQTGRYKPGKRPPYGYRKVGTGASATYEVESAEAAIVRRIFTERAAGASLRRIPVGLNRNGIPSPTGQHWRPESVKVILDREVYATGKHPCWRTRTVRDADGVPQAEKRPAEERYFVDFPAFLDPALVERARATAGRNVWASRRDDRPAEVGILRYGFARCAHCGRGMPVSYQKGIARYVCTHFSHVRPCAAPASIAVDLLDGPILTWLQTIIEDPNRADAYRVEHRPATPDAEALAAALAAERSVADLEQQAAVLAKNLALVSGAAAQIVAEQLNALNDDLTATRVERDRLAAACRVTVAEDALALAPQDALAATVLDAIEAMVSADPGAARTFTVLLRVPEGVAEYTVPLSWKAWQAALAVFGVTVAVAQGQSGLPRWVAEMHLPTGVMVSSAPGSPDLLSFGNLFSSPSCCA